MNTEIAYCGYDCTTCLGWIAYQIKLKDEQEEYLENHKGVIPCAGCHAKVNVCETTCGSCAMRQCGMQKDISTCSECSEYPCINFKKD